MGAKRILALGSVAALCAGAAAPLFVASAASAADATSLCTNSSKTLVVGVNLIVGACNAGLGRVLLPIAGPLGATGPLGVVGPTGGTGGTGGTGFPGENGVKGVQGLLGGTGGTGAQGGTGAGGAEGPIGITGITGLGATGVGGTGGDSGIIGPQGPTGAIGVTGPTGSAVDGTIFPGCNTNASPPQCRADRFNNQISAASSKLGNTNTYTWNGNPIPPSNVQSNGPSQIVLTCPAAGAPYDLISGGAEILPADVNGGISVRGVLESSFPNPANNTQWIVSAVVTGTSISSIVFPQTGGAFIPLGQPDGPNLIVDPYVICRPAQ